MADCLLLQWLKSKTNSDAIREVYQTLVSACCFEADSSVLTVSDTDLATFEAAGWTLCSRPVWLTLRLTALSADRQEEHCVVRYEFVTELSTHRTLLLSLTVCKSDVDDEMRHESR